MKILDLLEKLGIGKRTVGPKLGPETRRRVELLFSPEQQEMAVSLLVLRCGYGLPGLSRATEAELERFRFAALKVSDGDLNKLRAAVDLANLDFRDLLLNAGFGDVHAHEQWLPGKKR